MKILLIALMAIFMNGCATLRQQAALSTEQSTEQSKASLVVKLIPVKNSQYMQVEGTFTSMRSRLLIFSLLSDLDLTEQWFDKLLSIETLVQYNNNQFLMRSVMDSPWPIQNRELITCVTTEFNQKTTLIDIRACSERARASKNLVSITKAYSSWTITTLSSKLNQITYKAWLDPAGNIPAVVFNRQLIASTKRTLSQLQVLLDKTESKNNTY